LAESDRVSARDRFSKLGFVSIENAIRSRELIELKSEALLMKSKAKLVSDTSEYRHRAHQANLGESGYNFLLGRSIVSLVRFLVDGAVHLEGGASCYAYYQPGDHLDSHLDHQELCKVTVIAYLDIVRPKFDAEKTGLQLHVLGELNSNRNKPKAIIETKVGSVVVGLGSKNWHRRPELQEGEYLTAITACYSTSS